MSLDNKRQIIVFGIFGFMLGIIISELILISVYGSSEILPGIVGVSMLAVPLTIAILSNSKSRKITTISLASFLVIYTIPIFITMGYLLYSILNQA